MEITKVLNLCCLFYGKRWGEGWAFEYFIKTYTVSNPVNGIFFYRAVGLAQRVDEIHQHQHLKFSYVNAIID